MQQPDPRGIHLYYIHSNYREWILRGRLFTFLLMTVRNYSNCFWAHLSILWPVSVTYNPPYHTHTHAHNKKVITCAGLIFILMRGRAPECSSFIKYRKLDLMYARYSPKRRHFNESLSVIICSFCICPSVFISKPSRGQYKHISCHRSVFCRLHWSQDGCLHCSRKTKALGPHN